MRDRVPCQEAAHLHLDTAPGESASTVRSAGHAHGGWGCLMVNGRPKAARSLDRKSDRCRLTVYQTVAFGCPLKDGLGSAVGGLGAVRHNPVGIREQTPPT